jgi:hypothetical protein
VKCSLEEEESLDTVVLEVMAVPFQERKRGLASLQVPWMEQVKISGSPATGISGMWSSGFWIRSGGEGGNGSHSRLLHW